MLNDLAPIVLFVYNRLDNTKKTIEYLKNNNLANLSEIYIISDGAKTNDDLESILKVRNYLKKLDGFKKITIIERKRNYGLAYNIISGINNIINKHGKVIVLEDDIITSEYFLDYMNNALNEYKDIKRVMAISSNLLPMKTEGLSDTFFLPWFNCWGWATWKDRWSLYERNPKTLISKSNLKLIRYVNVNGTAPDMWSQVDDNYLGRKKTWAIFFSVLICKKNGAVLYPRCSLSNNIGFDGSGENCPITDEFSVNICERFDSYSFNLDCVFSKKAINYFEEYNRKRTRKYGYMWNIRVRLRTFLVWVFQRMKNDKYKMR